MTRAALDSNVLIYALVEPETVKGKRATDVILRASRDGVVPVQALAEFVRFAQRRAPASFDLARSRAQRYASMFTSPTTTSAVLDTAAELARDHRVQLWDAVICIAAAQAGAKVLLSEDMQDGRSLGGLRLLNPFNPANDAAIDALLPPIP